MSDANPQFGMTFPDGKPIWIFLNEKVRLFLSKVLLGQNRLGWVRFLWVSKGLRVTLARFFSDRLGWVS